MFNQSRNTFISGGTFVQTSTAEGFKILCDNIAAGAFHNSGERFDAPKCHPKTRVAVLAEIRQWAQDMVKSEDVLWLYGSAGAGKSAIAQTIAESCDQMGLLVASFFFSRTSQLRNNAKYLIASIAYQLALSIPETRTYIESAVQIDPVIFAKSLDTQMETLIVHPLRNAYAGVNPAVAKQWPRLIIIDGLDECHDPSIQSSIIRVLSAALLRLRNTVPVILFVASRPEPHIRTVFNSNLLNKSPHIVLDDSYEPDADIKELLLSRFKDIKENHQLAAMIPKSWPSECIIDRLVRKSSGQFIYASTVMKYLESPKHRPMKRLDVILGLIPVDGDMPYKELDALYICILSCIEDFATSLKILGFLILKYYLPSCSPNAGFLARLLGLDEEDVHLRLSELHSILYIPPPTKTEGPESVIRVIHASLQDFLLDKLRSGNFYLDEEAFHTDLTRQCLHQICTLSINPIRHNRQGLPTFPGLEKYFLYCFIYHCTRASTDSTTLKNDLMQIRDLRPWYDILPAYLRQELPSLFAWLHKADAPSKELTSHFQSLWDQRLTISLDEYTFHRNNVDIAGFLFLPTNWHLRWSSLISGISQVPDVFESHPIYIYTYTRDYHEPFRSLFTDFFEDRNRSGKYYVDGTAYAYAALECFRNMFNPNDHCGD